jgi:4-diphosphocytidyl-2-C-methyl-D-erythritol kinase
VPDPGDRLRLAAPAKLNLWLRVVGRRSDGFHELESLLALLELADALTLLPDGPGLTVEGPHATSVPDDPTNLAWRGWTVGLRTAPNREADHGLVVDKQIPVAAGLGGGSSDAAAAWRLARRASGESDDPPDQAILIALAEVGADVPFFASRAAAARVGGIGEIVKPLEEGLAVEEVVLVHPPFSLSTASVFAELKPADWSTVQEGPETGPGRNDLLPPATRLRPELDDVFRLVTAAGGAPHLTGSGPTVFVLTDDPERADGVARRVERAGLAARRTRLRAEPASIEPW